MPILIKNQKISEHQWLTLIDQHQPDRATLLALAKETFRLSRGAVDKNIAQAVAAGFMKSLPDPENWRKRVYQLTAAGQRLLASNGFAKELGTAGWGYRKRCGKQPAKVLEIKPPVKLVPVTRDLKREERLLEARYNAKQANAELISSIDWGDPERPPQGLPNQEVSWRPLPDPRHTGSTSPQRQESVSVP